MRLVGVERLRPFFTGDPSPMEQLLAEAAKQPHVMEFTLIRVIEAMFALIRRGLSNIIEYNESRPEPMAL